MSNVKNIDAYFNFSEEQTSALKTVSKQIDLQKIIDIFYAEFTKHPQLSHFFKDQDIDKLKNAQLKHWKNLLNPETHANALNTSVHIGNIHEKIGLTPVMYLSGYLLVFNQVQEQIISKFGFMGSKKTLKNALQAINTVLLSDISASLEAYVLKNEETAKKLGEQTSNTQNVIDSAVNLSIAMNDLFVDSLHNGKIATEVEQRVNMIAAAIEEMTATVSTISHNAGKAQESTQEAGKSAILGRETAEKASNTMNFVHESVSDTMQKAQQLAQSSRQIEGIVIKIQDIAEQTNLLALNATIEAARAGDAGKGFAVVANEVKNLSNETSKATEEISNIIKQLVDSIQDILMAMNEVEKSVDDGLHVTNSVRDSMYQIETLTQVVQSSIHDISGALGEQSAASKEISNASADILESSSKNREMSQKNANSSRSGSEEASKLISTMAEISSPSAQLTLKLAKSDHIIWKRKLADLLMGNAELSQDELKDHSQCRLGKWYYSEGKTLFADNATFKALEEPHKNVHVIGLEIYELNKKHNMPEALNKFSELDNASKTVIELLDTLFDQVSKA